MSKFSLVNVIVILLITTFSTFSFGGSLRQELESIPAWANASYESKLDVLLIYALTLTESQKFISGDTKQVSPHPWTLRSSKIGGKSYPTHEAAKDALKEHLEKYPGVPLDIGIAQVSTKYHLNKVKSPFDLLDLETNLRVCGMILKENQFTAESIHQAIGRYNHWVDRVRADRYADEVFRIYLKLIEMEIAEET